MIENVKKLSAKMSKKNQKFFGLNFELNVWGFNMKFDVKKISEIGPAVQKLWVKIYFSMQNIGM